MVTSFFFGQIVKAAGLENPIESTTICQLLQKISGGAIAIGGSLSAVLVLIGAFQFLFSAGDPKRVELGKKTILYTVIGYVILLSSSAITYLVADLLGGGTHSWCP